MDAGYPFPREYGGAGLWGLVMLLVQLVAMWRVFTKSGEPGWASLIPLYNLYVLYRIGWGKGWAFLWLLVPVANLVAIVIQSYRLALAYGKGTGFALGLLFLPPIFYLILGYGRSSYIGPQGIPRAQYEAAQGLAR